MPDIDWQGIGRAVIDVERRKQGLPTVAEEIERRALDEMRRKRAQQLLDIGEGQLARQRREAKAAERDEARQSQQDALIEQALGSDADNNGIPDWLEGGGAGAAAIGPGSNDGPKATPKPKAPVDYRPFLLGQTEKPPAGPTAARSPEDMARDARETIRRLGLRERARQQLRAMMGGEFPEQPEAPKAGTFEAFVYQAERQKGEPLSQSDILALRQRWTAAGRKPPETEEPEPEGPSEVNVRFLHNQRNELDRKRDRLMEDYPEAFVSGVAQEQWRDENPQLAAEFDQRLRSLRDEYGRLDALAARLGAGAQPQRSGAVAPVRSPSGVTGQERQPTVGETRTLPDGTTVRFGRDGRWYARVQGGWQAVGR
jgi:hypothetical protein